MADEPDYREQLAAIIAQADQTVAQMKEVGRIVTALYASLIAHGMPRDHALYLTNSWFMNTLRNG